MLKLTLKPGEYLDIGNNVRVIFSGGSSNNIHLLIDAPKEVVISRSNAAENRTKKRNYYSEKKISAEAQKEIAAILMREKKKDIETIPEQKRKTSQRYYTAGIAQRTAKNNL